MDLSSLLEELRTVVKDDTFTDATLTSYINEVYKKVLSEIRHPSLKRIATVTTNLLMPYTTLENLPGGFSGNLLRARSSTNTTMDLALYPNLQLLMDEFSTMEEEGDVEAVALEGSTLWYQKVPAELTGLIILYIANPVPLTASTDVPLYIPEELHRSILVYGAASIAQDLQENGIEGQKVEYSSHSVVFQNGTQQLKEWLGMRRNHFISSCWRH